MPLGARVTGSRAVSSELPKLMPTRNFPLRLKSERTSADGLIMIGSKLRQFSEEIHNRVPTRYRENNQTLVPVAPSSNK